MCLCWMVCPPSRGLISPCFQLSPHMCACVGWCVRLPEVLPPLVSHCFPLSPHMCACVGWCVRSCLSLSPHMCACVGWYLRLGWCVRLLSHCLPMSHSHLDSQTVCCEGFLMLSHVLDLVPQNISWIHPAVWGLRWCNVIKHWDFSGEKDTLFSTRWNSVNGENWDLSNICGDFSQTRGEYNGVLVEW